MDADFITFLGREVLVMALKLAAPMLLAGMGVGIFFAFFQSITSVQEQTMTMIPKMIAVVVTLLFMLPWILRTLHGFTTKLLIDMAQMGG